MKTLLVLALAGSVMFGRAMAQSTDGNINTIFVIVLENHDWSEIYGNPSAPYINLTLLPRAAYATQYYNPPDNHPSLPNYLWLEGGDNFGVGDDGDPSENAVDSSDHLSDYLDAAGFSWKAYEEDISGRDCPLFSYQDYAPKHDPFVYFNDVTDNQDRGSAYCISHIRPFQELATDLATGNVANYNFITPNLCNDMHDCDPSVADAWLSGTVEAIRNSSVYGQAVVFVVWDESEDGDGPIGLIADSPWVQAGYSNSIYYTHSSLLATVQNIFQVYPLLGDANNATDLSDLFVSY